MTMKPGALIDTADVEPYPYRRRIERERKSATTYVLVNADTPAGGLWCSLTCPAGRVSPLRWWRVTRG